MEARGRSAPGGLPESLLPHLSSQCLAQVREQLVCYPRHPAGNKSDLTCEPRGEPANDKAASTHDAFLMVVVVTVSLTVLLNVTVLVTLALTKRLHTLVNYLVALLCVNQLFWSIFPMAEANLVPMRYPFFCGYRYFIIKMTRSVNFGLVVTITIVRYLMVVHNRKYPTEPKYLILFTTAAMFPSVLKFSLIERGLQAECENIVGWTTDRYVITAIPDREHYYYMEIFMLIEYIIGLLIVAFCYISILITVVTSKITMRTVGQPQNRGPLTDPSHESRVQVICPRIVIEPALDCQRPQSCGQPASPNPPDVIRMPTVSQQTASNTAATIQVRPSNNPELVWVEMATITPQQENDSNQSAADHQQSPTRQVAKASTYQTTSIQEQVSASTNQLQASNNWDSVPGSATTVLHQATVGKRASSQQLSSASVMASIQREIATSQTTVTQQEGGCIQGTAGKPDSEQLRLAQVSTPGDEEEDTSQQPLHASERHRSLLQVPKRALHLSGQARREDSPVHTRTPTTVEPTVTEFTHPRLSRHREIVLAPSSLAAPERPAAPRSGCRSVAAAGREGARRRPAPFRRPVRPLAREGVRPGRVDVAAGMATVTFLVTFVVSFTPYLALLQYQKDFTCLLMPRDRYFVFSLVTIAGGISAVVNPLVCVVFSQDFREAVRAIAARVWQHV